MTTTALNKEGIDPAALAEAIESWLAASPERTATMLAEHAGINPRGIWQLRNHQRPEVTLDWADRLTLAMDVPLHTVAPPTKDEQETEPARRGKQLGPHVRCISAEDLKLAYELHRRGVPLNRIARTWQQSGRISYSRGRIIVDVVAL
jgi:hypothetical protein